MLFLFHGRLVCKIASTSIYSRDYMDQEIFENFENAPVGKRQDAALALNHWFTENSQNKKLETVSLEDLTKIYRLVCENLTISNPGYTNILRDLLSTIISFRNKAFPSTSYESWVEFIVAFPSSSKAVYHVLEPLAKYVPRMYDYGLSQEFYSNALKLLKSLQFANPVGRSLANLMRYRKDQQSQAQWVNDWSPYVYECFNNGLRENVLIYLVPALLRPCPAAFDQFYTNIPSPTIEDQIGCLKVAHDLGLETQKYLKDRSVMQNLQNISRFLRFEVLSLLISCKQVAKPIDPEIYHLIRENAAVIFCEANPKFRNQVYGLLRRFLFRIRQSTYALHKKRQGKEEIEQAKEFLNWMVEYMMGFMRPGTPYRGLATGFQFIELLVTNGLDKRVSSQYFEDSPVEFQFSVDIFTKKLVRILINSILNDFYDIRQAASRLLQMAPKPTPYLSSIEDVDKLTKVSAPLLAGVRARQGDAGAQISEIAFLSYPTDESRIHLLENLLHETEQRVEAALRDIKNACHQSGVHGYFQALSLIFGHVQGHPELVRRAVKASKKIWHATQETLTNSAPEGNIPIPLDALLDEDNEILSGKHGATAQVLLSFSWQAVKESSNLLVVLVDRFSFSDEELIELGDMTVAQLTSIRHRGAFSAICPSYEAVCRQCYRQNLDSYPINKVKSELENIIHETQLITRRSGGLPMLITGTLVTIPQPAQDRIDEILGRLFEIARLPLPDMSKDMKLDLPQVHAFNCIRGALRESRLGKATEGHIESGLVLALRAFSSPVWAIRNCGVMLFSTLHTRLFGTRSTMSAGVFFGRYKTISPLLYDHLVGFIDSASGNLATVYPILSLLLRLKAIDNYDGLTSFRDPIIQLLRSEMWKVREMSSWVLSSILNSKQISETRQFLLENCSTKNQNELHGYLMALNALNDAPDPDIVARMVPALYSNNSCAETKVEMLKLCQKAHFSLDLAPETCEGLNPSIRIINSIKATEAIRLDHSLVSRYLVSDEREVIEAVLDFCVEHPDCVDDTVYALIVRLLENPNPSTKNKCLDVISVVGIRPFALKEDHLQNMIGATQPLSVQQRALKSLGAIVGPNNLHWIKTLKEFSDDDSPLDSRLCAVFSLQSFLERNERSKHQNELYWIVYMLLSDDEEVVRSAASSVASKILGSDSHYAPRFCEPRILELISPDFVYDQIGDVDFKTALETDETLFIVEKPNLYRDELTQLEQVASRVKSVVPRNVPSTEQLSELNLETPLGWSSNGDLQIILARLRAKKAL